MVSVYTRERGLVEAVARGIGKPGSSLSAAVEPFTLSKLFFAEGRGVDRLTQCRVLESFYDLRRDMRRFAYASCGCELVLRTTEPSQVTPGLFEMLEGYLRAMVDSDDPELLSCSFQLAYLRLSGLAPVLDRCVECGKEIRKGVYSAGQGGLLCEGCAAGAEVGRKLSAGTVRFLEDLAEFDLDRIRRLRLTERARRDIRAILHSHIRYHLDLSLKSEGFLKGLRTPDTRHRTSDQRRTANGSGSRSGSDGAPPDGGGRR